jgi:hypothetical protein
MSRRIDIQRERSSVESVRTAGYVIVASVLVLAFFSAYGFAVSRRAPVSALARTSGPRPIANATVGGATGTPAASGCACCSGGATGAPVPGTAKLEGGVQRISVDASKGTFEPNEIHVKAGIPVEIAFGEGSGCVARVLLPDFGVSEDLTSGGAIVRLPPLKGGTYGFSCEMRMRFGTVVAE